MIRVFLSAAATLLSAMVVLPGFAVAQPGDIQIINGWSRAAMAGRNGAVFLTIIDKGGADKLIGATSPIAEKVELHESFSDQGVMKMRAVAGLPVSAEKPVTLAPGGYHLMLLNLRQALKEGDSVPLTLTFEKAGPVTIQAGVAKAGAGAPPMAHAK